MKTKKLSHLAMLGAIAIIFGYIEMLFPVPISIPGIKLGLGNIAVLVSLYIFNSSTAWFVMLIKVIVSSLLFSTPLTLIYSLAGGIFSFIIMTIMKRYNFNIITVSIGGGIFHNTGQLITAGLILKNINILYYLPILIIVGSITATAIGVVSKIIIKRVKKIL